MLYEIALKNIMRMYWKPLNDFLLCKKMIDKNKRSKNDERRAHVERKTGEKHKHRVQQEKINEADRAMRDFCFTQQKEHPYAD